MTEIQNRPENDADEDRRKFLATCGKFAVVTPPAVTLLLSTSLHSSAVAQSAGSHKNGSWSGGGSWGGRGSWGGGHSSGGRRS